MRRFAELICQSNFSFLKSASHPEELVEQAASLGYSAIAITDECSLAGIVRAHQKALECNIQLLVGAQFVMARHSDFAGMALVLLVKNKTGYTHLCRLITQARARACKGDYQFTHKDLADLPPGLLLLVQAQEHSHAQLPAFLAWCAKRFTGRMAVACHTGLRGFQHSWLAHVQTLAQLHGLPMVASNMALMHAAERKPLHDLLTAIRLNCCLNDARPKLLANAQQCLQTLNELSNLYPQELLNNTLTLAEQCTFSMRELQYQYPREICPSNKSPIQYLTELVNTEGLTRYPQGLPPEVQAKIAHELELIAELKYEAYFLTVYDLVKFARSRGILCQGRGSAANSVVCYCLGITEVSPEKLSTLFERFISRERNEPPDIDVDFEHTRREEVIQYIYGKYGRHRAALAASVVVYRPRSALRDAGKALGLRPELVDAIAKSQDGMYARQLNLEHLQQAGINPAEHSVRQCLHMADQLLGFPRHLSQHTGGFVIACNSLDELVPVENAAMPERSVIQWDKDDLDAMGLLKVDVLALGMLSAIRLTLEALQNKPGAPTRLQDIPSEDPATYRMISKADTIGVFQIESRAQMGMLPRLRPRQYYDLVVQVAIVRPGPIQGGMVHPYLKARANPDSVVYPSDALKTALGRTLGVPIFQEQVMQIAILAAGFTPGEADQLRRGMAAWKRKGNLHQFYERVVHGMVARGYEPSFAERIFRQIEGFGEYGFPESHAASFALLVYASAWLKCNHPDAFLCGLLNAQPMGFYAPSQLIQDAQAHGVKVLPVDVAHSEVNTVLQQDNSAKALFPVRLGLQMVHGLSQQGAIRVVAARRAKPYDSIEDLAKRAELNRKDLQALADANALQSIAGHRRQAAWHSAGVIQDKDLLQHTRHCETQIALPAPNTLEDMLADFRSLGASIEHHPVRFIRPQLAHYKIQTVETLKGFPDGRLARACGLVTHRQRPATAHGTVFLNLEDETGHVNVIVWSSLAEQQRHVLRTAQIMGVFGIWQRQGEVCNLVARRLVDYTHLLAELKAGSRDFR
ncbi:error-prone DNA polymerase [Limnobacter sp.]|uniref:error-prone DNA polymerase n=1 Tax=Limnobacter sp. TaxID=2003368 RepID=UPI0035130F64